MPAVMVRCVVCGQEVSKRSTLSLSELGGGNGRACRAHELVRDLVESKERKTEEERVWAKGERAMRIVTGTALVRVLMTFHGVPPEVIYTRLKWNGYSSDVIEDIKKEVAEEGGPEMGPDEIEDTLAMAAVLKQRSDELVQKN